MENWCIGVWGCLQEHPHEKKPKNIKSKICINVKNKKINEKKNKIKSF
jgi:hypothetical protein